MHVFLNICVLSNWILIYSLSCSGYWTKYLKLLMQLIGKWLSNKTYPGISLSDPSGFFTHAIEVQASFLSSFSSMHPIKTFPGPYLPHLPLGQSSSHSETWVPRAFHSGHTLPLLLKLARRSSAIQGVFLLWQYLSHPGIILRVPRNRCLCSQT